MRLAAGQQSWWLSWETVVDLKGEGVNKIGVIHELRIEVGLDHRGATSGGGSTTRT